MLNFNPGSKLAVLFHKAWGQAKESPEYDKEVWKKIDGILSYEGCGDQRPAPDPTHVTFKFPTPDAAGSFIVYMSDGGGEQPFLSTMDEVIGQGDLIEADRVSEFDYSDDTIIVAK